MLIFAAGAAPAFFTEVAALIFFGALIAFVAFRLGLVPIVGFLLAGVIIGPHALGLVQDQELVDAAAEVGVILLLFTIGIEFSMAKLARIKRLIFLGGGAQVLLATALTAGILRLFGVGWAAGIFTGFLVALSSTAIVLKLLADRHETEVPHGQVALGLLIFQDLAIIAMVLLVPMLAGEGGGPFEVLLALGKAAGIIVLVLVVARRLMPRVLEAVARTCSPELFLLSTIAICFGTAYLTSLAGVSLSLGAFLAGLVVSESRFSEHAMGEILPLQILFSATFFISVGLLLDLGFLFANLPLVLGVTVAVLAIKLLTTAAGVRLLGYPRATLAASALLLAQIGEFSFVLERAGREVGLHPAGLAATGSQTFIAATVLLMVLTPLLSALGGRVARAGASAGDTLHAPDAADASGTSPGHAPLPPMRDHVIVAGYGRAAREMVPSLERGGVPYVITTLSPDGATEADALGYPVLRGDASKQRTLELAGLYDARMLVIPDDDPATAGRIAAVARPLNPEMEIVVRTRYRATIGQMREAGADQVVSEEAEGMFTLADRVLRRYDAPAAARDELANRLRASSIEGSDGAGAARPATDPRPLGVAGVAHIDTQRLERFEPLVGAESCGHLGKIRPVLPSAHGCEECLRMGHRWVHLAHLHDLWPRRLLRLFAQPARNRALPRHRAPDRALAAARRALGLVFRRRDGIVASGRVRQCRRHRNSARSRTVVNHSVTSSQPSVHTSIIMHQPVPLSRSALLREILIFQIKLVLDGFKDIVLLWASIGAGIVDLLFMHQQRGAFFRHVLDANRAFEEWVDLNGSHRAALRDP